ncbi:MAG: hypothetical protein A3J75_04260 [Acidobacteria bacterium RBG_16_68_9]|nr:MAG: hypothetical protein A3J75_04260 [Acidobacteria bacterium RBG_16_68_9]
MTIRRGALLGFGNVAAQGHVPAWGDRRDFQIVAVADPDPQRRALAARLLPAAHLYADAATLLEQERLDFVDIATPPALHASQVAAAAATGCHILCEKPLATSWSDHERAAAAVRASGATLFTVHNWKHAAQFRHVATLLADGALGRLRRIRFDVIRNGQAVSVGSAWRTQASLAGGGILVDHGWHAFYLLLALAGERPQQISASIERRRDTAGDVEDTASCTVEFPSLVGELWLTWAGSERRTRWQLVGERGSVEVEEDRLELRRGGVTEHIVFPQSLSAGSHHPDWFGGVIDGFKREVTLPSVRGENLAEAELCLLLTTLAYESARQGRPVTLPAEPPLASTAASNAGRAAPVEVGPSA